MPYHLPPSTIIAHVDFKVSDLGKSLDFYRDLLGFQVVEQDENRTYLSVTGTYPYHIVLTEQPNAIRKPQRTSGLYHVAILMPDRHQLGRIFKRLIDANWRFQGFADHNVSEALYLSDPDGNGLEIYRDRPRSEWKYDGDQIYMSSDPIDADGILALADNDTQPYDKIHPDTIIGHVHLHVSELAPAEDFYINTIGFDMMLKWQEAGAYFLAVGGYHHHLGMNIWAGQGVPRPPENAVGLKSYALWIEKSEDHQHFKSHIEKLSIQTEAVNYPHATGIALSDPSQNVVEVLTPR